MTQQSSIALSVGGMLRTRVPSFAEEEALLNRIDGEWRSTSWREFYDTVRALALELDSMGLKKGDSLAILSNVREEWTTLDTAAMSIGLLVVGIYHSSLQDSVEYILKDSDAKLCLVEDEKQLEKVEGSDVPGLHHVVGVESDGVPSNGTSYEAMVRSGRKRLEENPGRFDELVDAVKPTDLATLVYTSGTTGLPKGAMLTHANLTGTCESVKEVLALEGSDRVVLYLPLAHIFARVLQFVCIERGITIAYPPYGFTPGVLFKIFEETAPTFVPSVPRIFEKIHASASARFDETTGLKRSIVDFAFSTGRRVSEARQKGQTAGFLDSLKHRLADKLLYSKVKARFGGRVRFFVSGGAPLSGEIQRWFHSMDMLILEGYGLTETTAASFINRVDAYRFGTVGRALPGTEIKIADDGEILLRGTGVFQGYFNREELTRESLTPDGWFSTGDIGHLDDDGFLRITDRKKDLIVTAGGKNVAPQYVESRMKTIPLISQILVHGDRRKFISALVTLDADEVSKLGMSYDEAVKSPKIRALVEEAIASRNKELESYHQVKKFAILEKDFTIDTGELTPKLSVKRKVVTERHKDILDGFYGVSS